MTPQPVRRVLPLFAVLALAAPIRPAFAQSTPIARDRDARAAAPSGSHPWLRTLPVTWSGMIPCADCVGLRLQLDLLPGGGYLQRSTYLRPGRDESFYQIGSWSLDGRTLTLDDGGPGGPVRWQLANASTLRKLDRNGIPIASRLPYELRRTPGAPPVEPRARITGMFSRHDGGPRLRECASGLAMRVETSDDFRALDQAFNESRPARGAELKVILEARIETRPSAEGVGAGYTLIVEKFLASAPGERCARPSGGSMEAVATLENNRWRAVRIESQRVVLGPNQREPWIHLEPREHRVTGSGGCNRLSGTYGAGESLLRFGPIAATRMACMGTDWETPFFRALEATRRYRIQGRTLELLDRNGRVVATLEEANL